MSNQLAEDWKFKNEYDPGNRTLDGVLAYVAQHPGWNPDIHVHLWLEATKEALTPQLVQRYPSIAKISYCGVYPRTSAVPYAPSISCFMSSVEAKKIHGDMAISAYSLACIEIASYGPQNSTAGREADVTMKVAGRANECAFRLAWLDYFTPTKRGSALCFEIFYRPDPGNLFRRSPVHLDLLSK